MENEPLNPRLLRVSGILVILGLLVEAFTLVWSHPITFSVSLFVGGGFVVSGIMVFLYTFVAYFVKCHG
jgi:polyferredoxin